MKYYDPVLGSDCDPKTGFNPNTGLNKLTQFWGQNSAKILMTLGSDQGHNHKQGQNWVDSN